jgi:hypothetical protein
MVARDAPRTPRRARARAGVLAPTRLDTKRLLGSAATRHTALPGPTRRARAPFLPRLSARALGPLAHPARASRPARAAPAAPRARSRRHGVQPGALRGTRGRARPCALPRRALPAAPRRRGRRAGRPRVRACHVTAVIHFRARAACAERRPARQALRPRAACGQLPLLAGAAVPQLRALGVRVPARQPAARLRLAASARPASQPRCPLGHGLSTRPHAAAAPGVLARREVQPAHLRRQQPVGQRVLGACAGGALAPRCTQALDAAGAQVSADGGPGGSQPPHRFAFYFREARGGRAALRTRRRLPSGASRARALPLACAQGGCGTLLPLFFHSLHQARAARRGMRAQRARSLTRCCCACSQARSASAEPMYTPSGGAVELQDLRNAAFVDPNDPSVLFVPDAGDAADAEVPAAYPR